jgi:hypothetical protein
MRSTTLVGCPTGSYELGEALLANMRSIAFSLIIVKLFMDDFGGIQQHLNVSSDRRSGLTITKSFYRTLITT